MGSINFLGSYSGIDQSMIDQLMAAEKMPLIGMSTKVQDYETEKNAWKDINTRMNTLSTKINDLKNADLFTDKKVTSSVSGIVDTSVSNSTVEGAYEIEVTQLATSTRLIGNKVGSPLPTSGNLNIKIGETEFINFDVTFPEKDPSVPLTLNEIAEGINSSTENNPEGKDPLVRASVIDSRLVIESVEGGEKTITLTDDSGSDNLIDSLGMSTVIQGSAENIANRGNNSEFTINGISVTDKSTNTISDVVDGITFTLTDEGTTTLTVSNDYSDLESKIQAVVDQYNSTLSFMQSKSKAGNPDSPGSAGDLSGDSALQRLISNLRTSVSDTISDITTDYKAASSIGITTVDNEGTLAFDKTKFQEAMNNDSDAVKNFFFSKNASAEDTGFANKLDGFLEYYIDGSDGIIASKESSLESMIDTVNDKMDAFNLRMEAKEAYYLKIFASLDAYMAKAESTTSWLTSQMGSMNSGDK